MIIGKKCILNEFMLQGENSQEYFVYIRFFNAAGRLKARPCQTCAPACIKFLVLVFSNEIAVFTSTNRNTAISLEIFAIKGILELRLRLRCAVEYYYIYFSPNPFSAYEYRFLILPTHVIGPLTLRCGSPHRPIGGSSCVDKIS